MYYNNLNRQQEDDDDDLKFIPLNIKEPFAEKDSSWYPIVNMNSPNISHMTNNFILGVSTPMENEMLDGNFLNSIDYVPNVNYSYTNENGLNTYNTGNLSNNMMSNNYNQGALQESGDLSGNMSSNSNANSNENNPNLNNSNPNNNFNLEYPSETESEMLYSYNKEDKCVGITGMNNTGNMNTGAASMDGSMWNTNTGITGAMGNTNTGTTGTNNMWNMNTGVTSTDETMWNMNTGITGMNGTMGNMNTGITGMNNMWNTNAGITGMNGTMGNMNTGITGMNSMWNIDVGGTKMDGNMGNSNINNIWDDNYQSSMDEQYVPFTSSTNFNLNPNNPVINSNMPNNMNANPNNIFPSNINMNPSNPFMQGSNGNMNNSFTDDLSGRDMYLNNVDMNYTDDIPTYTLSKPQNMNPLNMVPNYTIPDSLDMNAIDDKKNNEMEVNPILNNSYNSYKKLDDYIKTYEKDNSIRLDEEVNEPLHMEILRGLDLGSEYEGFYRGDKSNDVDRIFKIIEEKHGAILSTLKIYRIPNPIASLLVKKIIKITLEHYNKE